MSENKKELSDWICMSIMKYIYESPENSFGANYNKKAWGEPLVGFSKGDDPLYLLLKEDIGDFIWTPIEIFSMTFPDIDTKPIELTVISWILPQSDATKSDMRQESTYPAEKAILSRLNSDIINKKLAQYLIELLNKHGYQAVSPVYSPFWENKQSIKYGYASSWSERHAAYISGLGTFSLTDTLITPLGTAVRIGSVIAKIPIAATERKYAKYNEYCLYFSAGGCLKCVKRCPAGALSANGHDKLKCREYQREITSKHVKQNYNIDLRYCGLCQFDIPCESCIPNKDSDIID